MAKCILVRGLTLAPPNAMPSGPHWDGGQSFRAHKVVPRLWKSAGRVTWGDGWVGCRLAAEWRGKGRGKLRCECVRMRACGMMMTCARWWCERPVAWARGWKGNRFLKNFCPAAAGIRADRCFNGTCRLATKSVVVLSSHSGIQLVVNDPTVFNLFFTLATY